MIWFLLLRVGIAGCPDYDELRNPYFGDLHVHTHLSLDASAQGTTITPKEAYEFAQGKPIKINESSIQIEALDFVSVTDHAEFLGEQALCTDSKSSRYGHPMCRLHRKHEKMAFLLFHMQLARPWFGKSDKYISRKGLCGWKGQHCIEAAYEPWQSIQSDAHNENEPCEFSTFVGYEWTGSPRSNNLHRNVIFSDLVVPSLPTSYFEAPTPELLWQSLDRECKKGEGCEVLTIPHNSNLSAGKMFVPYSEESHDMLVDYAQWRSQYEPLIEIFQHKGSSECGPLSTDEDCSFEQLPYGNLTADIFGRLAGGKPESTDAVRSALAEGMKYVENGLSNPYQYGIIASTDTHLGTPGFVSEQDFVGHGGLGQSNAEVLVDNIWFNPGGLAVVWAEENSRESIFDSMQRREVYGTSGPRMRVRFFGGEEYPDDICEAESIPRIGYFYGVSMGGELWNIDSPVFVADVYADKAALEEIQIIKIWREGDSPKEKVVSILNSELGSQRMCVRWQDEDYQKGDLAAYYLRVLEVPTQRWTALRCESISCDSSPKHHCCGEQPDPLIQERAWTSPIWIQSKP